ncbi:PREDICTED: probable F-box protein At1g44080 [Fragaria vesca subsp. vesca]|uniref:probable F-box protein At1g44080 n=1 Tax=Fragaria vesca subsp. vesca TaxID=101020 RepID=UPI0002C2FBE4|nr:PREDICTED: probable F-box protein At1g44080 [Fragaria vesca subsp. vesca]
MDNLPMDIIENIGKCLNTNTDVSVFRAVCKSWRSSIPASQIKSPIRVCIEYKGKKVLNLIESVVYGLVKPPPNSNIASSKSCSFVVKVRESDQENRVFRVHPLSSLPCPPALNWLDFKVLELGKSLGDPNFRLFRAAISSNPDWPAVMVVAYSNLYCCKLGAGACKHVEIEKCSLVNKDGISELHCWRDVVFYKGVFYAVSLDDTTIAIDSSLEIKLVKSSPGSPVGRKPEFTWVPRSFVVYKLNAPEMQWVLMRSLNDGIIFVGDRHFDDGCFAAPAQDFPGFHENHIYFSHKLWFGDLKMEGSLPYSSDEFEDI